MNKVVYNSTYAKNTTILLITVWRVSEIRVLMLNYKIEKTECLSPFYERATNKQHMTVRSKKTRLLLKSIDGELLTFSNTR